MKCKVPLSGIGILLLSGLFGTSGSEVNYATEGIVSQSTTGENYEAYLATDGNEDSNFTHGSCSRTARQKNPWWMVVFTDLVFLKEVILVSRKEQELQSVVVNAYTHKGSMKCGSQTTLAAGEKKAFRCSRRAITRAVKITSYIYGNLELCEVIAHTSKSVRKMWQVEGVPAQSSTFFGYGADKAFDGKLNDMFESNSCSMTHEEVEPWWMVTFKNRLLMVSVSITTRADCCGDLTNFDMRFGPQGSIYKTMGLGSDYNNMTTGETQVFRINDQPHRWIGHILKITIRGKRAQLTLCEVLVYAVVIRNAENRARLTEVATPSQSSSVLNNMAVKAVDGNADGFFEHGSCTITKVEKDPWWMVTFKPYVKVYAVYISTRHDCCGEARNVEVTVGPNKVGFYTTCGNTTMTTGTDYSFDCPRRTEGYNVKITAHGLQSLALCEVHISGTGECFNRQCTGGTCVFDEKSREVTRCICGDNYPVLYHTNCDDNHCLRVMKKIPNKKHSDGERRPNVRSLRLCKKTCLQDVTDCAAIDFKNGVCWLHYKSNYDQNSLSETIGCNHYYLAPKEENDECDSFPTY